MRFRITPHAGHDAPADAVDQLLATLAGRRGKGRFYKVGREMRVSWGEEDGSRWDRPELVEVERVEVLDMLRDTCRAEPHLNLDWYAVGPLD
jgi:hypothetical protein